VYYLDNGGCGCIANRSDGCGAKAALIKADKTDPNPTIGI
jgi:hypothetical protein